MIFLLNDQTFQETVNVINMAKKDKAAGFDNLPSKAFSNYSSILFLFFYLIIVLKLTKHQRCGENYN